MHFASLRTSLFKWFEHNVMLCFIGLGLLMSHCLLDDVSSAKQRPAFRKESCSARGHSLYKRHFKDLDLPREVTSTHAWLLGSVEFRGIIFKTFLFFFFLWDGDDAQVTSWPRTSAVAKEERCAFKHCEIKKCSWVIRDGEKVIDLLENLTWFFRFLGTLISKTVVFLNKTCLQIVKIPR